MMFLVNLENSRAYSILILEAFLWIPRTLTGSPLSVLEVLDMSWVDLNKASNWLQAMNTLHSLSVLILSDCGLDSINPLPVVNFSSLTVLHLSDNQFVSPTFDWFSSLGSLASLDLSSNNFHGPIPTTLCNLTALRSLHLFNNSLLLLYLIA